MASVLQGREREGEGEGEREGERGRERERDKEGIKQIVNDAVSSKKKNSTKCKQFTNMLRETIKHNTQLIHYLHMIRSSRQPHTILCRCTNSQNQNAILQEVHIILITTVIPTIGLHV